jgi:hypothetical protein
MMGCKVELGEEGPEEYRLYPPELAGYYFALRG